MEYDKLYDMLPELGESLGSADSIIDEQFPHIAKKLIYLWGSKECMEELEDLINFIPSDDRPTRMGFPFYAIQELVTLQEIHHKQFPNLNTKFSNRSKDVWKIV